MVLDARNLNGISDALRDRTSAMAGDGFPRISSDNPLYDKIA